MDLQCGVGQGGARQLQQVRAVLDLATVPGVFEGFALFLVSVSVRLVAIECFGFVAFDAAGEKSSRRHLFLVAADHGDLTSKQGRQGEFHRHLRSFVVDHGIEQAGLKRQHTAGHVRVHQPYRT
ncbi:hypothetical protein D3C84_605910 [compost metagenome]